MLYLTTVLMMIREEVDHYSDGYEDITAMGLDSLLLI